MKTLKLYLILFLFTSTLAYAQKTPKLDDQIDFAVNIYRASINTPGNLLFSPYSLHSALAMAAIGADANTLNEFNKALYLTPKFFQNHKEAMNAIMSTQNIHLYTANKIWPSKEYSYSPLFLKKIRNTFGASIQALDYFTQAETSRKTINQWVEDQTKNNIKELVPRGQLDSDTKLVITNAIYFNGTWKNTFDSLFTRKQNFYVSKNRPISTYFMQRLGSYNYWDDKNAQLIEIPYEGDEVSLLIALPSESISIKKIEEKLTSKQFIEWIENLKPETVNLEIPKFKLEKDFGVIPQLNSLGLKDAFMPEKANFSKMSSERNPIFISDIYHKASIDVSEKGTEASAATAVSFGKGGSLQKSTVFTANRPFLYFIYHKPTNIILFMGRLATP